MLTSTNGLPFSGAWITCSRIIAPDDDCNWTVTATCLDDLPLYGSLDCKLSAE